MFRFIGEHKPYREKGYIGSAYKQIRIKTDKALNLTVFDGALRTSKREVASVLTYYRYLTNFEQIIEVIFLSAMSLFISLMVNGFYGNYFVTLKAIHENCTCETSMDTINPWLLFLIGICVYVAVFFITKYI